jgi:hypothetical protein
VRRFVDLGKSSTHPAPSLCGLQKDPLAVKVNQLSSIKTQLPYSYYSLPFCRPGTIVDSAENLGEVLRGDRIENSLYVVSLYRYFTIHLCLSLLSGYSVILRQSEQKFTPVFLL